jgi:hypothetical protein
MSDGTPPLTPREWRFYLDDMIEFSEKILTHTDGFDQSRFEHTGLNYDAALRNLELVGDSARVEKCDPCGSTSLDLNTPLLMWTFGRCTGLSERACRERMAT